MALVPEKTQACASPQDQSDAKALRGLASVSPPLQMACQLLIQGQLWPVHTSPSDVADMRVLREEVSVSLEAAVPLTSRALT